VEPRERGQYVETRITARGEGAFRATALEPADAHALRIAVRIHEDDAARASARAEIDEALAEDPTHVVALWHRARMEGRRPEPASARAAAARHPGDPRAWALLAMATAGDERLAALRRGVAVGAGAAPARGVRAEGGRRAGRAEEAWPVAIRAARLAPWSSPVLGTAGEVALALGRCAEAVAYTARAIEVLPESAGGASALRVRAEERARGATARCARAPGLAP
jgi:tetratricopeptide (TPR) repeat protein